MASVIDRRFVKTEWNLTGATEVALSSGFVFFCLLAQLDDFAPAIVAIRGDVVTQVCLAGTRIDGQRGSAERVMRPAHVTP
jgi:hypothetical protein